MSNDVLGPPPIEPLSDLSWARIEHDLWLALDTAPPPPLVVRNATRKWVGAAALVAVAAIVLLVIGIDRREAPQPLAQDPARVVSNESTSAITVGDAHVTLDPHTAVAIEHDAAKPTVLLERGAATFAIAPRGERAPFTVIAGDARVRVVGTRFRVARDVEVVVVEVEHGVVEVQYRGTRLTIREHERWTSETPAEVTSTVAVIEPPKPVQPPPPPPDRVKPRPTPPPSTDDRATYQALAKLEATEPQAAITGYLALAKRNGAWSEVAQFAAARLAADRRDPRAATLLATYLQRYPHGANADDARELLAHTKGTQK